MATKYPESRLHVGRLDRAGSASWKPGAGGATQYLIPNYDTRLGAFNFWPRPQTNELDEVLNSNLKSHG